MALLDTYSVSADITAQAVDIALLSDEIASAGPVTGFSMLVYDNIDTIEIHGASINNQSLLDSTVLGHSGIPQPEQPDQTDSDIETAYSNQVSIVSQGDAEAGTSTVVVRWTPERVKQAIEALSGGWVPNPIPLGAILVQGAQFIINASGNGCGFYVLMDGSSNDRVFYNDSLNRAGAIPYDGSDLRLRIHCRLGTNGAVDDTIKLQISYGFTKDGDNSFTASSEITEQTIDVSSKNVNIKFTIDSGVMTGVAGAEQILFMVRRRALGGGSDTYPDGFEITALEFIKA